SILTVCASALSGSSRITPRLPSWLIGLAMAGNAMRPATNSARSCSASAMVRLRGVLMPSSPHICVKNHLLLSRSNCSSVGIGLAGDRHVGGDEFLAVARMGEAGRHRVAEDINVGAGVDSATHHAIGH